jgi:adenine deaminase
MVQRIKGNIVDIPGRKIFPGEIAFENGRIIAISGITPGSMQPANFILPGFIDAHVHIESSMLVPSEFARLAVVHGTVATVSDPHEIANVCGMEGVEFMIENAKTVPFKFYFGAPSCVPATPFETAGALLSVADLETLLKKEEIKYLSEMMDFPAVLQREETVMNKIAAARIHSKPIDGHAPGLRGEQAKRYIEAGISTDHECFTMEEALDKLRFGMKIIIREGSAAKNFEALADLFHDYSERIMFCSDDKHPDSLVEGHINQLCARAVAKGIDVFNVLQAACINPVLHYKLESGLLKENDPADFIVVSDLKNFEVIRTYINGILVAEKNKSFITGSKPGIINQFNCSQKKANDFHYLLDKWGDEENMEQVYVIEAMDGQLITNKLLLNIQEIANGNGFLESKPDIDILKIVVVNRYKNAPIAKSFIKNIGLKYGAIASSVAHDSHNIVAVGVDDESLCRAVNLIIREKGGISCVRHALDRPGEKNGEEMILPLPVAGLMSDENGYAVAIAYTAIDSMAKSMGSTLSAPFMTLSFMALLVIPHLKLSDMGLFDADGFRLL